MKEPLVLDFEPKDNGLSVEYQCEFYADKLYGVDLFNIWNYYLLNKDIPDRSPKNFFAWLQQQDSNVLKKYGIADLKKIPKVHYMTDPEERKPYLLTLMNGNILKNARLRAPTNPNDSLIIIYSLEAPHTQDSYFCGGEKQRGYLNHPTFTAGQKPDGAGHIYLTAKEVNEELSWVIKKVDNKSGHYKPGNKLSIMTLEHLKDSGVDLSNIFWHSHSGSSGPADETGEMALKRLKKEWTIVDSISQEEVLVLQSPFITALKKHADLGHIMNVYEHLITHSHEITVRETHTAINLILKALENGLQIDDCNPKIARSIAKKALKFMHDIGEHSEKIANKLNAFVVIYQALSRLHSSVEAMRNAIRDLENMQDESALGKQATKSVKQIYPPAQKTTLLNDEVPGDDDTQTPTVTQSDKSLV